MTLNPFKPFRTYLKPYKKRILLGLFLLSIGQLASSAIPLALRESVDLVKEWLDGAQGGIELSGGERRRTGSFLGIVDSRACAGADGPGNGHALVPEQRFSAGRV